MAKKKKNKGPSDKAIRELLVRYQCPKRFHAVRAYFLGQIASPSLSVSPMKSVQDLWGGELPEFESEAAAKELIEGLAMGLWDRLTAHQSKRTPFHLARMNPPTDALTYARYARVRREELEGFMDGVFGESNELDLPETAHHAMGHLTKIREFMAAMGQFAGDKALPDDMDASAESLIELTRIAELEINAAVTSCARARREQRNQGNY